MYSHIDFVFSDGVPRQEENERDDPDAAGKRFRQ